MEKAGNEVYMTLAMIDRYLEDLAGKGRSKSSRESYRRILIKLYSCLPEGKAIGAETGSIWKAHLEKQGYLPATIDSQISVWNSFVKYLGHKEWQLDHFSREKGNRQPELTRTEYLRLLSAAKQMGKERAYLLIKTLGGAGMRIQELPQLTAEAVKRGMVELEYHNSRQKRVLYLPEGLRRELLDYMAREEITEGVVFRSAAGEPMARTNINYYINTVCRQARVGKQKATPRCLWKMYQSTCMGIRSNISVLIEQAYQHIVEEEQLVTGWNA